MDHQVWHWIIRALRSADRRIPPMGRRCTYSDQLILKIFLWVVWQDRPLEWMKDSQHFHPPFQPARRPSYSQFCRRLSKPRIQRLLRAAQQFLTTHRAPTPWLYLDGKALTVSDYSRDRDARNGHAYGRMRRGYRLHALVSQDQRLLSATVTPLNRAEPQVARRTLLAPVPAGVVVLGDANYDADPLYRALENKGAVLLTPLKGRSRVPARLRKMSAARREAIRLWDQFPQLCEAVLEKRGQIERTFGRVGNFGGGLGPLPNFVRHLGRVQRWVTAKVLLYHARLRTQEAA